MGTVVIAMASGTAPTIRRKLHLYLFYLVCVCAVLGSSTPEESFPSIIKSIVDSAADGVPASILESISSTKVPEFEWRLIDEALKEFPVALARAKLESSGIESEVKDSGDLLREYGKIAFSQAEEKCSAELDVRAMLELLPHSFQPIDESKSTSSSSTSRLGSSGSSGEKDDSSEEEESDKKKKEKLTATVTVSAVESEAKIKYQDDSGRPIEEYTTAEIMSTFLPICCTMRKNIATQKCCGQGYENQGEGEYELGDDDEDYDTLGGADEENELGDDDADYDELGEADEEYNERQAQMARRAAAIRKQAQMAERAVGCCTNFGLRANCCTNPKNAYTFGQISRARDLCKKALECSTVLPYLESTETGCKATVNQLVKDDWCYARSAAAATGGMKGLMKGGNRPAEYGWQPKVYKLNGCGIFKRRYSVDFLRKQQEQLTTQRQHREEVNEKKEKYLLELKKNSAVDKLRSSQRRMKTLEDRKMRKYAKRIKRLIERRTRLEERGLEFFKLSAVNSSTKELKGNQCIESQMVRVLAWQSADTATWQPGAQWRVESDPCAIMQLKSVQSAFDNWRVPADGTAHTAPAVSEPHRQIPGGFYSATLKAGQEAFSSHMKPPTVTVSKKFLVTATANMTKHVVCVGWSQLKSAFLQEAAKPQKSIVQILAQASKRAQQQSRRAARWGGNKKHEMCPAYQAKPIAYDMPDKSAPRGLQLPLDSNQCALNFRTLVVARLVRANCNQAFANTSKAEQCAQNEGSKYTNMTSTSGQPLASPVACMNQRYLCPKSKSFMCLYEDQIKDKEGRVVEVVKTFKPNVCLHPSIPPKTMDLILQMCGAEAFGRRTKCCTSTNLVLSSDSTAHQRALDTSKFMDF